MDYYRILGVGRQATLGEVRRAYRRLARKYHPDINPGDSAAAVFFDRVVDAYQTLNDPDRRGVYDAGGDRADPPRALSPEFRGFDFSTTVEGSRAATFAELFADLLPGARPQASSRRPEQGTDLHGELTITFQQAVHGGWSRLPVTRLARCVVCDGQGFVDTAEVTCPHCRGAGATGRVRGHMVFERTCDPCQGTGRARRRSCDGCGGDGVTPRSEAIEVPLPSGVRDGARLRVGGRGHAGRWAGETGDLYVTIQVEPHPIFQRDGDDLLLELPVAIHEAALGARVAVPALDGPATIRIPAGTQSGQRFRLRGRGAPSGWEDGRGDLIVQVRLVLPSLLDERSKELLREFGEINTEDVRDNFGE